MALNIGWTNHLLATQSALQDAIARIESIAVAGKSPSGNAGQALTPLTPDKWAVLHDGLDDVVQKMESLVEDLAPKEATRSHERQPLAATRYHLSLALLMLQEQVIDDLDPGIVSRYGDLDAADRERLIDTMAVIREQLTRLRSHVAALP